jgi:2-amino-4-hydroxy-6-hydroxymethyldihydropteridine diphosphokinase
VPSKPDYITAYIGLGSNLGDRAGNLLLAVRGMIEANFAVNCLSNIYETEPLGLESSTDFLNMVAEVRVRDVRPTQMMARLLRIEYVLGRREKAEKKPRTIDLDLLFFGKEIMDTPFLTLPHPRLHLRKFVLVPLAEIAPNLVHPLLHQNTQELLRQTDDISFVSRWNPNGAQFESLIVNS